MALFNNRISNPKKFTLELVILILSGVLCITGIAPVIFGIVCLATLAELLFDISGKLKNFSRKHMPFIGHGIAFLGAVGIGIQGVQPVAEYLGNVGGVLIGFSIGGAVNWLMNADLIVPLLERFTKKTTASSEAIYSFTLENVTQGDITQSFAARYFANPADSLAKKWLKAIPLLITGGVAVGVPLTMGLILPLSLGMQIGLYAVAGFAALAYGKLFHMLFTWRYSSAELQQDDIKNQMGKTLRRFRNSAVFAAVMTGLCTTSVAIVSGLAIPNLAAFLQFAIIANGIFVALIYSGGEIETVFDYFDQKAVAAEAPISSWGKKGQKIFGALGFLFAIGNVFFMSAAFAIGLAVGLNAIGLSGPVAFAIGATIGYLFGFVTEASFYCGRLYEMGGRAGADIGDFLLKHYDKAKYKGQTLLQVQATATTEIPAYLAKAKKWAYIPIALNAGVNGFLFMFMIASAKALLEPTGFVPAFLAAGVAPGVVIAAGLFGGVASLLLGGKFLNSIIEQWAKTPPDFATAKTIGINAVITGGVVFGAIMLLTFELGASTFLGAPMALFAALIGFGAFGRAVFKQSTFWTDLCTSKALQLPEIEPSKLDLKDETVASNTQKSSFSSPLDTTGSEQANTATVGDTNNPDPAPA